MVKSGDTIEELKVVGRGKNRRSIKVKTKLRGRVFFPEKPDGTIDLMEWYLTENEALFFEAVEKDGVLQECKERIDQVYKERNERWNFLCDKFGVDRKVRGR